jgi:hypothetical protein
MKGLSLMLAFYGNPYLAYQRAPVNASSLP